MGPGLRRPPQCLRRPRRGFLRRGRVGGAAMHASASGRGRCRTRSNSTAYVRTRCPQSRGPRGLRNRGLGGRRSKWRRYAGKGWPAAAARLAAADTPRAVWARERGGPWARSEQPEARPGRPSRLVTVQRPPPTWASRWPSRRLRGGARSCRTGRRSLPHGAAPSRRPGRDHPYVRSCPATGTE